MTNYIFNITKDIHKKASWFKSMLAKYGVVLLILFSEFFLFRLYESIYLNINLSLFSFELKGIYYDYLFLAFLSVIFIIPFSIIYKLSEKLSIIIFYIINTFIILIFLILIDYLKHTSILLDHTIFAYPIKELLYITRESTEFNFFELAKYLIAVILGLIFTKIFLKKIRSNKIFVISLIFIFSGIFLTRDLNPARNKFVTDISFNLNTNKFAYFSKSCLKHLLGKSEINALEFNKRSLKYQGINPTFNFTSQTYSFEHKPDTTDLLGHYFCLNEEPPNIVFIIMESLSRAFCGEDAYLGSFTPFIDSLIPNCLYWENFLSTSERTFNVLPSIFGSLPYGKKGFMSEVQPDYTARHSTLIKWLNNKGYQSNFFYGGWTGFDNMENFMKYQDIDFILSHFGSDYSKIKKDKNGISWGYPDKSVYQRSFEILDSISKKPRLDIYLTLSLHQPFRPPNEKFYHKRFLERIKDLGMNDKQKEKAKRSSEIYSTILYTDDALRSFFNQYKKRDDYKNTIFIITGDHRIGMSNTRSAIDIYHVPFIIFSPMLNKTAKFSSVSSHANITPTFVPFLSKNFNFEMPQKVHWLGKQIDFSKEFRNIHITPLMKINREITDYLSGNYFLSNGNLYVLKNDMQLQQIKNQKVTDSLTDNLTNFVFLNQYIINNNLLISHE